MKPIEVEHNGRAYVLTWEGDSFRVAVDGMTAPHPLSCNRTSTLPQAFAWLAYAMENPAEQVSYRFYFGPFNLASHRRVRKQDDAYMTRLCLRWERMLLRRTRADNRAALTRDDVYPSGTIKATTSEAVLPALFPCNPAGRNR